MRSQQKMGEPGNSVTDHVVYIPNDPIAGGVVCRRYSQISATQSHRHCLFAVSWRQKPIRSNAINDLSERSQLNSCTVQAVSVMIREFEILNAFDDSKTITLDVFNRITMNL